MDGRFSIREITSLKSETKEVIKAEGLTKSFDGFTAVNNISFAAEEGECFGLLGPNGAGKTTTLRMFYGMSPPGGGSLQVMGYNVANQMVEIKKRIGVVPQENNLDPDLNILENLLLYAMYYDIPKKEAELKARELLDFVNLWEKRSERVDKLSGGMKRRLVIARALINQPRLLILDEPTTGLDPQSRHLLWEKLKELKSQGITQVLTTHYMEEAYQLCDRIVIMNEGKIIEQGNPRTLVEEKVSKEVIELRLPKEVHDKILNELKGDLKEWESLKETLILYPFQAERTMARIKEVCIPPCEITLRQGNLEDVFLKAAGRKINE